MIPVTGGVADLIQFFERIFQIVLALALGEAFKQYFPERKDPKQQHNTVLSDATPSLISFVVLVVTFYLGMDRYFWSTYSSQPSISKNYPIHLMLDSGLFMFESALFFAMSRNLHKDRWREFYKLVAILLIPDIIWCIHGSLLGPRSFAGWIASDFIFLMIIIALRYMRPSDRWGTGLGMVFTVAITAFGYWYWWPLYFG